MSRPGRGPAGGQPRRALARAAAASAALAPRLLCLRGVSAFRDKVEEVLAAQFGVRREFTNHLLPLLEQVARQRPSAAEWERILGSVAAAYRSCQGEEVESLAETRVLVQQFVSELKKMDETIKVLAAFLERLRDGMNQPGSRVIH
jgi:hypothetical protein